MIDRPLLLRVCAGLPALLLPALLLPALLLSAPAHAAPCEAPRAHLVVSSAFGPRIDPVRGGFEIHPGIDLPGRAGSSVLAADDGVVRFAGWRGGYGMLVELVHPGGMRTRYGHLSRIAVHLGEAVGRGQVIAEMGSTGRSTGPHLHFEVWAHGRLVDPLAYLGYCPPQPALRWIPAVADDGVHVSAFALARRQAQVVPSGSAALPDGTQVGRGGLQ